MKIFFQGLWQIVLGLLAASGILLIANACVLAVEKLIQEVDPIIMFNFLTVGLRSRYGWVIFLILFLAMIIAPVGFGFLIFRDASKFKKAGIDTSPVWWGIGTFLPTSIIVLPVYFFRRNLIWSKRLNAGDLTSNNIKRSWKWPWVLIILLLLPATYNFVIEQVNKKGTEAAVEKIHNTKLTLDDVMGKNLPSQPDPSLVDATIAGVDANNNGIRDDVELAIFKTYPNSAKTRAVLLQYALALQMEVTQIVVNTETATAVGEQVSRSYLCVGKIISRDDLNKYVENSTKLRKFVEDIQLNTEERRGAETDLYSNLKGGDIPSVNVCDIDVS